VLVRFDAFRVVSRDMGKCRNGVNMPEWTYIYIYMPVWTCFMLWHHKSC